MPHGTPPPPSWEPPLMGNQTPDSRNQPPLVINGVEVPIPPGAELWGLGDSLPGQTGPMYQLKRGNSQVWFSDHGLVDDDARFPGTPRADIRAEDAEAFAPTLRALEVLASLPVPSSRP